MIMSIYHEEDLAVGNATHQLMHDTHHSIYSSTMKILEFLKFKRSGVVHLYPLMCYCLGCMYIYICVLWGAKGR